MQHRLSVCSFLYKTEIVSLRSRLEMNGVCRIHTAAAAACYILCVANKIPMGKLKCGKKGNARRKYHTRCESGRVVRVDAAAM